MSMAVSQFQFKEKTLIVVMGVAGCGKSTIGAGLSQSHELPFMDADDYHPAANVEKMSAGIALTDNDRWPWLDILGDAMRENAECKGGVVVACSALKRSYREKIAERVGLPVLFVFLDGSRELLFRRMSARTDHYMPPSLLDSQLNTLEYPDEDEPCLTVSIDQSVESILQVVEKQLQPVLP